MDEREKNQQTANQIINAGGLNAMPYRPGEWVALLDGTVIAVAGDLESTMRALRARDPDPGRGMVFEVGPPVVDVIR